jgi:hypothetical protein
MKGNQALLLLACGMMDLSWFYAWATFLTTAVLQHTFPFPEAVGSFVLAAALTLFSAGRGLRVIKIMALQALFFVPVLLSVLHIFSTWSYSLTHQAWLTSPFYNATASQDWLTFMLLILWVFPFWGGGMRLAWRTLDYDTICSRFDRGLVAFFALLLFKFMLTVKGNISIEAPVFEYLIFAFFIFSLLAIGLARNRTTTAVRDFIPGYQGIGVIFSFTVVVLLFCGGLTFFCLPYLTMAAEKSYAILKDAAQPFGSLFMIIIHFIFGKQDDWTGDTPEKPPTNIPKLDSSGQHSWWMEFFGRILAWGVWILLGLVLLLILSVSLYFFVQWLFSKTDLAVDKALPSHPFTQWMEKLRLFLLECWKKIMRSIKGYRGAVPIYGALQKWGRRSGLTPFISETPAEYGLRLQSRFPLLKQEIALIIESFHAEVYGGITLTYRQLTMASAAWFKMRSPRHWPRRLKTWFFRHKEELDPFPK